MQNKQNNFIVTRVSVWFKITGKEFACKTEVLYLFLISYSAFSGRWSQ